MDVHYVKGKRVSPSAEHVEYFVTGALSDGSIVDAWVPHADLVKCNGKVFIQQFENALARKDVPRVSACADADVAAIYYRSLSLQAIGDVTIIGFCQDVDDHRKLCVACRGAGSNSPPIAVRLNEFASAYGPDLLGYLLRYLVWSNEET